VFRLEGSPINELIQPLYDCVFLTNHRNIVPVGETGTGNIQAIPTCLRSLI